MGVPYYHTDMTSHPQYVTVRNPRGAEMMDLIRPDCDVTPSVSSGDRKPFVMQTVISDDEATLGRGQGLTLVHFSAHRKRFLWDFGYI
jgi:7-hydroxymethyl chlorophyll a reductase